MDPEYIIPTRTAAPSLLTPRVRSGVEQVEHLVRRFRLRGADVVAAGGAVDITFGPVPQGFTWAVDGIMTTSEAYAYVNQAVPDALAWANQADGLTLRQSPFWLVAGDRLIISLEGTPGDAVGVQAFCRLLEVEERAWPQAAPVSVVELLGQSGDGPELVPLEEPADG